MAVTKTLATYNFIPSQWYLGRQGSNISGNPFQRYLEGGVNEKQEPPWKNCFNHFALASSKNVKEVKILKTQSSPVFVVHKPRIKNSQYSLGVWKFFRDLLHSFHSQLSSLIFLDCITAFSLCSFVTRYTFSPLFYMAFEFFVADSFVSIEILFSRFRFCLCL